MEDLSWRLLSWNGRGNDGREKCMLWEWEPQSFERPMDWVCCIVGLRAEFLGVGPCRKRQPSDLKVSA